MKAFVLDAYAKAARLRLTDHPDPQPGPREVLVRIHAAGLNQLDSKIRDGAFKPILPYKLPLILGHDLAGVVEAVGAAVTGFAPGDAVFARPRDGRIGTLAERIAVDHDDLALMPQTLTMAEAAGIPLVGLTAWQALVELADVQPGQKVLIHAGSGGFGSIAIQLAKHLGATVATTTSTGNLDMVRALGADLALDYRKEPFETVLSGYDLVVCGLDGDTLAKSLRVLKPGGRLISISGPPTPEFARRQGMTWLMQQVMRLLSLGIRRKARARGIRYDFLFMRADGGQLAQLAALIEAGAIRPVIDRIFPFDQTNDAFAYLDTGRAKGKVVVALTTPRPSITPIA
ncbi:NADP-dependent oxidoreductase (plasmid) [Gemmobacter fulvus]|uniref:NADP-dependent oxidoreductase n=1 Tax=Gemmobacter fulvus TaxID=2840474 RepID=A0A975P996_9RHOB|nr:NADP-dependent oxidoreductase [Gemmobacter fulvus]MBT9246036.1 NADP-dependent oxidoreductase [Gemmobacter fulvus]QWK92200.1 NADP-dependent oxidoreductase [Gemmobacter fulvus]